MSARKELVGRLSMFLKENGLDEVYGVIEGTEGRARSLTFCKARILDGAINVYGTKFIQVKWQTAIRALPHRGNLVFTSEENAIDFIRLAFVDFEHEKALNVPTKGS